MEIWAWLLAYVLGFGLLQLFLYRYFSRKQGALDGATPPGTEGARRAPPDHDGEDSGDGALRCQHCGAANENEASFTYCRECASPLR
jgi:hypothetical protein